MALTTHEPDSEMKLFELRTLAELRTFGRNQRPLAFSSDSKRLVTISLSRHLRAWNVESGEQLSDIVLPVAPNREAMTALSPSGDVAAVGQAGQVAICDIRSGEIVKVLKKSSGVILSAAFSPDGKRLVTTGQDARLQVWDTATWQNAATLGGHKFDVRSVAFSPDGKWLASGGHDNAIKVRDATTWREVATLTGSKAVVWTVAFTADSRTLVSASDEAVRFWNVATWREVGNIPPPVPAKLLVLSPVNTAFAVSDAVVEGPLHFWRVPTMAEIDGK